MCIWFKYNKKDRNTNLDSAHISIRQINHFTLEKRQAAQFCFTIQYNFSIIFNLSLPISLYKSKKKNMLLSTPLNFHFYVVKVSILVILELIVDLIMDDPVGM